MARISGRRCQALPAIYIYSCHSKAAFQFGSLPGVKKKRTKPNPPKNIYEKEIIWNLLTATNSALACFLHFCSEETGILKVSYLSWKQVLIGAEHLAVVSVKLFTPFLYRGADYPADSSLAFPSTPCLHPRSFVCTSPCTCSETKRGEEKMPNKLPFAAQTEKASCSSHSFCSSPSPSITVSLQEQA